MNLRPEELAGLLASYNEAAEKLQRSHDDLQREVRRLHEELAQKNRQLERRKRLAELGEMAAGLAHEIRNPLGGIRLYADLLRRDLGDREDLIELVDKIIDGVCTLDSLVGEALTLTHTVEPRLESSDLVMIVSSAIELAGDRVTGNQTRLSYQGPAELAVRCDRGMLQRAVLNVIRNAVEASGQHGQVSVDVFRKNNSAIVQIADDGPGIDPQIADRIFNPFFTTKSDGVGLGLAIVHRIAEAHEGSVSVSRSPMGGAMFTMKLPVNGPDMQVEARRSVDGHDSSD